jgi:uncharacterized membrane protein
VGYYDAGPDLHGFMQNRDGTFITFYVPGSQFTSATGISADGQIAGTFSDANVPHGFLRNTDGSFITFDVPEAIETSVAAMNVSGQITGIYRDTNHTDHGFVRSREPKNHH